MNEEQEKRLKNNTIFKKVYKINRYMKLKLMCDFTCLRKVVRLLMVYAFQKDSSTVGFVRQFAAHVRRDFPEMKRKKAIKSNE